MTSKSFVAQQIDAIGSEIHKAVTKPRGYTKRGRHLVRPAEGLFHGIGFQGSQWGTGKSGQFTINLMVVWPHFHEIFRAQPMPTNPMSAQSAIYQRIGFLMPKQEDHWWRIDPDTRLESLITEITDTLERNAFPFLDAFNSVDVLVRRLCDGIDVSMAGCSPEYLRAVALCHAGDRRAAARTLRMMLSLKHPESSAEFVNLLLDRLKLRDS